MYRKLGALTAKAITGHLQTWFNLLGWPSTIRSDGGPQFCGYFKEWCADHNIHHEISSPYNPKSNGLAEAAVKNIKYLLSKCLASGENCDQAIYEWRNVPRSDGYSPAQLLFGRRQYTSLPSSTHHHQFYDIDAAKKAKDEKFVAAQECHDQHKSFLPPLQIGQGVIVQDPTTGLWADEALITSIRPDGLSYELTANGRTFLRSRKMLRPLPNFVHFTSPLLPIPISQPLSPWDQVNLPLNNPQSITTPNPTETNSVISTNQRVPLGSNLTGRRLVEEYPPSSLSACFSSPSGSPLSTTAKLTKRRDVQNYTSSSSSLPVTTESMINILPKSPRSQSVRLPGIPACRPLLPQQYPLENAVMRATQASSPGNSYRGNNCSSSSTCNISNNCPPLTSPTFLPVSPPPSHLSNQLIGPASGRSPLPQPGLGSHSQMSMNLLAAEPFQRPHLVPPLVPLRQTLPSTTLPLEEWPTLPIPSPPSWSGWTKLLRNSRSAASRRVLRR